MLRGVNSYQAHLPFTVLGMCLGFSCLVLLVCRKPIPKACLSFESREVAVNASGGCIKAEQDMSHNPGKVDPKPMVKTKGV